MTSHVSGRFSVMLLKLHDKKKTVQKMHYLKIHYRKIRYQKIQLFYILFISYSF